MPYRLEVMEEEAGMHRKAAGRDHPPERLFDRIDIYATW